MSRLERIESGKGRRDGSFSQVSFDATFTNYLDSCSVEQSRTML